MSADDPFDAVADDVAALIHAFHAFPDAERRDAVRALAGRVRALRSAAVPAPSGDALAAEARALADAATLTPLARDFYIDRARTLLPALASRIDALAAEVAGLGAERDYADRLAEKHLDQEELARWREETRRTR